MAAVLLQTLWMHWIWEPDLHVVVTAHLILLVVLIVAAIFCELAKKRQRARACGLLAVWVAVIAVVGVFALGFSRQVSIFNTKDDYRFILQGF